MTTLPLDNVVELSGASSADDNRVTDADHAKQLVALHAAATLVPHASLSKRELIRTSWFSALMVVWDQHDDWAIVYLPGFHHDDNETYAVHKATGRLIGGDCPETGQHTGTGRHSESTTQWLSRVSTGPAPA